MPQQQQERVTPFDWQRYGQQCGPHAVEDGKPKAATQPRRAMTADERAQRILARRWGSPYSKAGVPSRSIA